MDPAYLDYAATTPVREEVRAAMTPYLTERFGNPSSVHRWGRVAAEALEGARAEIADCLGARPSEIYLVRGGTESDNLAVLGTCQAHRLAGRTPRLLISTIEHHAVVEAAEMAEAYGLAELTRFGVDCGGDVDWDAITAGLDAGPAVVSAMWVNNETGIVLPVPRLAAAAKEAGAVVHSDASQAVGKVAVDVSEVPVDLLTATGHKIYGPKGTGLLFVREGTDIAPLMRGGGQERTLRPGTEDVAGAVGLATALRLATGSYAAEAERLAALRRRLEQGLVTALPGARINAGMAPRAPHVSSVAIPGVTDGRTLVMALDLEGVGVSGGSACASGSAAASHVISALYGSDDPFATIRFSFGLGSDVHDIERAIAATVSVVERVRAA